MKRTVVNELNNLRNKVNNGTANRVERYRYNNAVKVLSNEKDDGRWGKAFEMLFVSDNSRKTYVAAQGKIDGYMNYNGKRIAVEYKTNGGRISSLYSLKKPENHFIIYSMCFETRQTYKKDGTPRATKYYYVAPVVLKVSDFLAILEHCKATKVIEHKGKNDREVAIQGDSVKLAKCLAEYPITYNPNTEYTPDDFEELELW